MHMGLTGLDNKVGDGYAFTTDHEAATLLGNDNGRCPLLFVLILREIVNLKVSILGISIANKLNLVAFIDGLPAQVAGFLLVT
jgi:hypothetical protein